MNIVEIRRPAARLEMIQEYNEKEPGALGRGAH